MRANLIAGVAVTVLVAGSVAVGLYLGGSPADQRRLRFDERRVNDLRSLARAVRHHWDRTGNLAPALEELVDGQLLTRVPADPVTGRAYDYAITGPRSFSLCAVFLKNSVNPPPQEFWAHTAGSYCFEIGLDRRPDDMLAYPVRPGLPKSAGEGADENP